MNRFSVLTGVPDFTKGLVRELRVRWALEEMGLSYEEIRYPHPQTKQDEYLELQPFGQVPYYQSEELCMFESGAILLHLAEKNQQLLAHDKVERAHVYTWIFAALNSIEPFLFHLFMLNHDPDCSQKTQNRAQELAQEKLQVLAHALGEREYFTEDFNIAEIIMTTVLQTAQSLGLLQQHKNLLLYIKRNEARPAFKRALGDHLKLYEI